MFREVEGNALRSAWRTAELWSYLRFWWRCPNRESDEKILGVTLASGSTCYDEELSATRRR